MHELIQAILAAERIVVFTGAGVSTDSGIPDYRGGAGQYSRYQPVYYDEFLRSEQKRREYWAHKASIWPALRDARPGPAHLLTVHLNEAGRLVGLITQNIDGLHEKAGLHSDRIVNLHGSNLEVECVECGARAPAGDVLDRLAAAAREDVPPRETVGNMTVAPERVEPPTCARCGGLLKPATVMFGQSLRSFDLERAGRMVAECDLLLALGSTLTVQPAASFPLYAQRYGARLAIVTRGATPLDEYADFRIDGDIAPFCNATIDALL